MRFFIFALSCLTLVLLAQTAVARSVSYPDGWIVMLSHHHDESMLTADYTFRPGFAIGAQLSDMIDDDVRTAMLTGSWLVKRWNMPSSQANILLRGGVGVAREERQGMDDDAALARSISLVADWEDRRYMIAYENEWLEANDVTGEFTQQARFGIAPYVGDFGDLHTWFILQLDHQPEDEDNVTITPVVRLFQGTTLGEVGVSSEGEWLVNVMFQF